MFGAPDPGKDARCRPCAYIAWRGRLLEVLRYDETYGRIVCENCMTLCEVHVPVANLRDVELVRAAPAIPDAMPV